MLNRSKAPSVKKIDFLNIQNPQEGNFNNGIKYYGLHSGSAPVIKLDMIFNAGVEYQSVALQSVFANSLIKEAPVGKSPDETAEHFDYFGSFIETFSGAETAGLRLYVPAKAFDDVIPVFAGLIIDPLLPETEFEVLQKKYQSSILNNLKKTKYVAMRGLNNQIFGTGHPLGYFVEPGDAFKISHDKVRDFVYGNYNSGNCTMIISGDFNDEILSGLEKYFGNNSAVSHWSSPFYPAKAPLPQGEMEKIRVYEFPEAVQSSIYGGIILEPESDEDTIVLGILNTVLGGYFSSRLMKNIREDKGYTYGIGSFITEYSNTTVLKIASDVGVDVTKNAVEEIYREIKLLRENLIPGSELELVKNYMMGELISSFDGVIPASMELEKLLGMGRNNEYIYKTVDIINTITPRTLRDYAAKFLDHDGFSFAIAGKY